MRINSIQLRNFRIHSELKVEFSRGMNLLLGKNGAGKSSILEAIGVVLFGSKPRNNGNNPDIIRFGESEAYVEIEFTGNDEEIYIVEFVQKLSKREWKLYSKAEPTEILRDGDEIQSKLKALVGIDGELKNIYDNIIVAKQNEFINIYKGTEKDRQVIFDRIFETEIYRTIHEKFSKEMMDRYSREAHDIEIRLGTLGGKIENPAEISKELEEKNLSKVSITEKILAEKKLELKLSHELEERKKITERIQVLENRKTLSENSFASEMRQLDEIHEAIEDGKKALKIVTDEKIGYERYLELMGEIEKFKGIVADLKKDRDLYERAVLKIKELERDLTEIDGAINTSQAEVLGVKSSRERVLEEIQKLSVSREETLEKSEHLRAEGEKLRPLIEIGERVKRALEIAKENLKDAESTLKNFSELLEKKKTELMGVGDIHELRKKSQELRALKGERDRFRDETTTIRALLEQNDVAGRELSSGSCPYLGESCKNLEGRDISEYFSRKRDELNSKIIFLEKDLELTLSKISSLENVDRDIDRWSIIEKEIERLNHERDAHLNIVAGCKLEIEKVEFETLKFGHEHTSLDELKKRVVEIETERRTLDTKSLERELKDKNLELKKIDGKILEISENIQKFSKNKLGTLAEKSRVESILDSMREIPSKLIEAENEERALEERVKEFKNSHDLYIQNIQQAEKLEKFVERKSELENSALKFRRDIDSIKAEITKEHRSLESMRALEVIHTEEREIKERINEISVELGSIESLISELNRRLSKALEASKEIEEFELKLKKLRGKIELTKQFRENVKNMGEEVASKIIERISLFATENFRKITGRSDSILWSNRDSNGKKQAYSVVLEGMDSLGRVRKVNFGELSGGEQVAVAIAIRGAMSNLFTKTRFSIFDEPTNNLDVERRKSLADNIGEILVDLDQSIIVTHDDTFKEMAQKVIELDSDRN